MNHAGATRRYAGMADRRPSRTPDLATLLRRASWLRPLARRLARGAPEGALAKDDAEAGARLVLAEARAARELAELVLSLDEPARGVLLLRYLRGAGLCRVAQAMGCDEAEARTRLHAALARLEERLVLRHGSREAWLEALGPLRAP